ncbi:MAG: adenylate/guanylate cyclase domain-containing protein [Desulfovibrionaceae bacterium]|nr:adenylate/guanylate cyclase domain-containing protein [Desulfovibrionaceae bacterium]MBF0512817.1 adenylate/guanylate cyclase domain-containing protein [Desulfovibrionaceae bacterium]
MNLADALGFDHIASARLGTVFSELTRLGLKTGGVEVEAALETRDNRPGLALRFAYKEKTAAPPGAARFFNAFNAVEAYGAPTILSAFKHLPQYDLRPSPAFIEAQRAMLARPSREELLHDLRGKNEMLQGLSAKLAKYLSPQVYSSIFSGDKDVTLSTERKKLTVFFSDIVSFTQTTDDMQPEDLTWLLNTYLTEMSGIALAYGATVDKFIGDAMLMFFGDPQTLGVEQDARACLGMALAMQRRMAELETQWLAKGIQNPLRMRIGINTGYCNVGNFGSTERMDYTIIGGEVNLAARLEASADPGGILMSYETYALVQDMVAAEEREPLQVKGIRRSVRPFAVTSILGGDQDRGRYLKAERDGLNLVVDTAKMTGEARLGAIAELTRLVEELRLLP